MHAQLEELYGQLGFVPGKQRSFGASFKVFSLGISDDIWLDSQIRYLKTTITLQFAAIALTIVGLLLLVANVLGDAAGAIFIVPVALGIWSLVRNKKGSKAFSAGEQP